jgi:hypothetical protein
MSAICRNMGWRAVTDGTLKSPAPSITARPTPQEKRVFAEVAAKLRVSESALALMAIRALLDSEVPDLPANATNSGSRRGPDYNSFAAGRSTGHPAPGG